VNDETKRLQEMLERATAPGDSLPEDLDAETAALRESWLALGKLLADAQSATDEPWENWMITPRPQSHWRTVRWAVAVAASLLVAAGLAIAYRLQDGAGSVQPTPPVIAQDDQAAPQSVKPAPAAVAQPDAEDPQDTQLAAVPDELRWDDSLDDRITSLAQATAWAHQDWYAQAGKVNALGRELDEIKKDIEDGTL